VVEHLAIAEPQYWDRRQASMKQPVSEKKPEATDAGILALAAPHPADPGDQGERRLSETVGERPDIWRVGELAASF